jgi:hypothetical protein
MSRHIAMICSSPYFPLCLYRTWNYLKITTVIHTMALKLVQIIKFGIFQPFYKFLQLITVCYAHDKSEIHCTVRYNQARGSPELLSYQRLSVMCAPQTGVLRQVTTLLHVALRVLIAVVMMSIIFTDTTLCSPLKSTDVSEGHIDPIRVDE